MRQRPQPAGGGLDGGDRGVLLGGASNTPSSDATHSGEIGWWLPPTGEPSYNGYPSMSNPTAAKRVEQHPAGGGGAAGVDDLLGPGAAAAEDMGYQHGAWSWATSPLPPASGGLRQRSTDRSPFTPARRMEEGPAGLYRLRPPRKEGPSISTHPSPPFGCCIRAPPP